MHFKKTQNKCNNFSGTENTYIRKMSVERKEYEIRESEIKHGFFSVVDSGTFIYYKQNQNYISLGL